MPNIEPKFIFHQILMDDTLEQIVQKNRRLARVKKEVVREGSKKLVKIEFIR